MTILLEKALEAVRRLPVEEQDRLARAMLSVAQGRLPAEDIEDAHLPAVLEGLSQVQAGDFASDEEVEAALDRFGA